LQDISTSKYLVGVPHELHVPTHPVRVVTATSLFDGHDAAINIMRRILQAQGAEVIHLGHNRSVAEIVEAAIHEDVHAVAVSSYQGGHVEYFTYLVELLAERGARHVRVYGGGGGVITPEEIKVLHGRGVARIFSPEDGAAMGLAAMVNTIIADCDTPPLSVGPAVSLEGVVTGDTAAVARAITAIESGALGAAALDLIRQRAAAVAVPVLGITGTGGSGKSSLTDELVRRFRLDQADKLRLAVIAVDPTRRRSGGALLGDRIRMNALGEPAVFFRSLATRTTTGEIPDHLDDVVAVCKAAGFDLVIVETPGIGQGDAGIIGHVDVSMYVMTPEFGSASQLEKIDMLDLADVVVINKADDALRDVRRQFVRNRDLYDAEPTTLPVFATIASRFADDGVSALYSYVREVLAGGGLRVGQGQLDVVSGRESTGATHIVPPARARYLSEVADTVRAFHDRTARLAESARTAQRLETALAHLDGLGAASGDLPAVAADARRDIPADVAGGGCVLPCRRRCGRSNG
jgi:methylmalonyl-CoA mutase